jgi:hypothetical protein
MTKGEEKLGIWRIYHVVIESSNGNGRYQKEYIGPATSEDDAVEQARTVFKGRADDHLVAVEIFDQDAWTEDAATLPPDGDDWIPS